MKITRFSILTLMFIHLTFVPISFAQDYTQWNLPEGAIARLGKGGINEIAYSPDGNRLAVASRIGVWLYDTHTGAEGALFTGHTDEVISVSFSPDGSMLASGSLDKTVRLWEVSTGIHLRTFRGHSRFVLNVAFSPDGVTLASGSWDGTIRLWEVATGRYLRMFQGHTSYVLNVAFSPDGQTLASGSQDSTVRLWEVATGKHLRTLERHTRSVWSVSISPDGQILASGSWDGNIHLWEVATGKHLRRLRWTAVGRSVSFSPDGRTLAGAGEDGAIRLWEVATGKRLGAFEGHIDYIKSVSFSSDGRTLASASEDGTVRLWEVATGVPLRTLEGHTGFVESVSFSPDGQTLARSDKDGTVHLWEVATGVPLHTLEGHTSYAHSVSFSPNGRILASGSSDKTVRLWGVAAGEHLRTLIGHTSYVYSVSFDLDGRKLASVSADGTVRLWEVATGKQLHTLIGHTDKVYSVAFSPDGGTLATGGEDETVRLWEVATGKHLRMLEGHLFDVYSVSFSPDGGTLASGGLDGTVRLWEVATGKHLRTLKGHTDEVKSVAFSPDGTILASGSQDKTVYLWEVSTGIHLHTFEGHTNYVLSVSFSPDGLTLASGGADGTVLLWDATPFISEGGQLTQPDTGVQLTEDDTAIQPYEREMVRLIYFRPNDRLSRQGIDTELDILIRWSQYFFAEQMQNYGGKTFAFETDANGYARVHHVTGKFTDAYYHHDTYDKVVQEVAERFDTSRDVFLIVVDVSSEFINNEGTCGIGGGSWRSHDSELWQRDFGGTAVIPASGACINPSITAHELGHVFGLEHDFREGDYLMAYGTQERLSHCAAEWLDAHRFFNNDPTAFNETTTIAMQPSQASDPGTLRLQFELTDTDGLHQAQLIVPAAATDPAQGTKLHSCKSLNSKNQTIEFLTTDAAVLSDSEVTLQVVDGTGNITRQTFSLKGEDITSNQSPVAIGTIPAQTLTVGGGATTLNVSSYFNDPDNDVLNYKATSNNTSVVTVSVSGTQITITPRGVGSASVAVTASDGKLLVTQRISVHVRSVPIADATGNFDDPFEGTALQNPNWQWQNEPANWDVGETREGFLRIESQTNRNLWASDTTHLLYQETDADTFDVETHFFTRWNTSSGVNGLVVKSPADNNWVTLKFWSQGAATKGQIQYQARGRGLVADPLWRPELGTTELFFRLRKDGNTYTGWYKTRAADTWVEIGSANVTLTPPLQLGIYAGVAAGTGTLTVDYAYFRSTVDAGVLASPMLQFAAMAAPRETTLLPNYPNPFNPETWIPYQLSSPADVTVHIYAVSGDLVRRLSLGHRAAGMYRGRSRAAYWDGRNEVGEPVASGVYFYTLTADDFTATRKMLIRK